MENLDFVECQGKKYPVRYKKRTARQVEASTSVNGEHFRSTAADAEAAYWSLGNILYQSFDLPKLIEAREEKDK